MDILNKLRHIIEHRAGDCCTCQESNIYTNKQISVSGYIQAYKLQTNTKHQIHV